MCGIAGVLHKHATDQPIGRSLLTMAACLQHRGMDSAGMAVFGASSSDLRLQMMLPFAMALPEPQSVLAFGQGRLYDLRPEPAGFSACVRPASGDAMESDLELVRALEAGLPGATVSGLGFSLTVEKAVGMAEGLDGVVGGLTGTHGIAHLRLATEARIDPAHAQPFWGRPYPDIAVTHNGHITNYHKMRQKFRGAGVRVCQPQRLGDHRHLSGPEDGGGHDVARSLVGRRAGTGRLVFVHRRHQRTAWALSVTRSPPSRCFILRDGAQVALASEPQALHRSARPGGASIREISPSGGTRMGEERWRKTFDCAGRTTREINIFLKEAARLGPEAEVALLNPDSRHNLAVGLTTPLRLHIAGHVGYYCAGLCEGMDVRILGDAGWGLAENLMSGRVQIGWLGGVGGRRDHARRNADCRRQCRGAVRRGDEGRHTGGRRRCRLHDRLYDAERRSDHRRRRWGSPGRLAV